MQLVAYGAQDTYLTGQPSVTFFQAVYQQTTNFAMETIQQTVNGSPGNNGMLNVIVARNGDLLGQMEITLAPKGLAANCLTSDNASFDMNWVAERAIASVTLNIGGQQIDKHYQTWWRLYAELFLSNANKEQYNKMTSALNPSSGFGGNSSTPYRVHLPLIFFFNRNPGLFLPLVALQYHEVRLDFTLTSYFTSYFDAATFEVWGNYVYLDNAERTQFASQPAQYLIEQLQHTGGDTISSVNETSPNNIRLNFNHPVKELIWCYQNPNPYTTSLNSMWNFTTDPANVQVSIDPLLLIGSNSLTLPNTLGSPMVMTGSNAFVNTYGGGRAAGTAGVYSSWTEEGRKVVGQYEVGPLHQFKILLNGQDRFKEQYGRYFNQIQPFYYHTGNPYPGIYCYSFAIQPEEFQPTGSCNLSRIDVCQAWVALKAGSQSTIQKMFATNYNILNVASGMGGLAFSN